MATNRNNGQTRPADLARGAAINKQKLAELEAMKDIAKPKPAPKPAPKQGMV